MRQNTWLSVNEVIPPKKHISSLSDYVLTYNDFGEMSVGFYSFNTKSWSTDAEHGESPVSHITHWMHLPEKPIKDVENKIG